jgi:outer membrane receptor protein involved in Fe transport
MLKTFCVCLLATTISLGSALAQEAENQSQTEGKKKPLIGISTFVTVIGSKIDEEQQNVTQKVNVIPEDQVEAQAISSRNIAELLQYQPGVSATVLSRNDANWGSYGGLGPKYNSYLLDGLPIDSFVDTMSLDPWAFDRIETHQGPASVMYSNYLSADFSGNQAPLAGISNLVLKDRIEQPSTHMILNGGSWNTMGARIYHQDHKGNLHFFLGATYEQSDYTDYGAPNSWLGMLEDPSYKKMKVYGKATYFIGKHQKVAFFAQHTMHNGFTGRPNRDYSNNYDTLNTAYTNQVTDRFNIQLKSGFRNYDRRWGSDNYPTGLALTDHSGVQQKVIPTDLTFNFKHSGESMFTAGTDMQYAGYKTYTEANAPSVTGNDATSRSNGFYLQEKLVVGNLVLRAGGRVNRTADTYNLISGAQPGLSDKSWTKFLWSAGIRYSFSKRFALYSNAGSSFISPAAKSVGGTLLAGDLGVEGRNGQLPNPDLRPESGVGSDYGLEITPTERVTFGVRGFYNRISDVIVDNVISNNPSQTKSINAGDAQAYGLELVYKHQVSDWVHLFANYTQTSSRISNPLDKDQDGSNITFVPNYLVNAGLEVNYKNSLKLTPYLHAVGEYYDSTSKSGRSVFGPYQVLNLKIEKTVYRANDYSVVLFTDLNNLTHRRYLMPWQFRNPGFDVLGGLHLVF